jgi:hypothetical protein
VSPRSKATAIAKLLKEIVIKCFIYDWFKSKLVYVNKKRRKTFAQTWKRRMFLASKIHHKKLQK